LSKPDPRDVELPDIPVHKTKNGTFHPPDVLWDPPNKHHPGKVIYDPDVQRVYRQYHADKIQKRWNISLANPVHLSVREDDTEAIIDGLHTTAAAMALNVVSLPCIRHWGLTLAEEAAFHLFVQADRKADSAADKWTLRIKAQIPEYVTADKVLRRHGLAVGNQIRAAGAVIYVVENFGAKALEQVILTMNAWCGGTAKREDWTANAVIRGLGFLFGNYPLVAAPDALGRKLQKKTTPVAMAGQVAAVAKGGGGSGSRTKIAATLIAEIWNTRRSPSGQFPMGVLGVYEAPDEDEELDMDEYEDE
jgi:hypothetical protein